jgi:hypothetical protein
LYLWGSLGGCPKDESVHPNSDYRITLTQHIDNELESQAFIDRSKDGKKGAFSRDRKLNIRKLIAFIMGCKSALQRELDRFYTKLFDKDFNIREVTKGALTQARAKLNPWAFKRLNQVALESFYRDANYFVWGQKRLLAVDGTRLMLPNHPSIVAYFGQQGYGPNGDCMRSMANVSILYDVLNQVAIDSEMAPLSCSEQSLLLKHLCYITKDDLLLLDRGYASRWLFFLLKAKEIDFCIRLKTSGWKQVEYFVNSGEAEQEIWFELPEKDKDKLSEYPDIAAQKLALRLVRVELPNGEVEVLCTTLHDKEKYPAHEFGELYHNRWQEEEAFKLLKSRAELEKFSGITSRAVQQDFYSKIFMITMCAAFAHPVEEKVRAEYRAAGIEEKAIKINRTNALAMLVDMIVPFFLKKKFERGLQAFDNIVSQTKEIIRPGRSEPRHKKQKKPFHTNYKPL